MTSEAKRERSERWRRKKWAMAGLAAVVAATVLFAGIALAVPPGKTNEYEGGGTGKVVFDGTKHADKGLKCNDCHVKIFKMKRLTEKITMAQLNSGKLCGECHNGVKAFATGDPASCARCHQKK